MKRCAAGSQQWPVATGARVDGVLLDVDDTLVDTRRAFAAAIARVTHSWLRHLEPEAGPQVLAHWLADSGGHYRAYTRGELSFAEQRRHRASAMLVAFGCRPLDTAAFQEWNAEYDEAFRSAWQAFPESAGFLDRLAGLGLRRAAVTNAGTDHQLDKLHRVGLAERLGFVIGTDVLGVGKPDPAVFALACERLGTTPERTVYVGDELDVDARGAQAAGLVGVWLRRPHLARPGGPPTGMPEVSSLSELAALLEESLASGGAGFGSGPGDG